MVALCGLVIALVVWRGSRPLSAAAMLQRLPRTGALIVYIDFDALRRAGLLNLLAGSKIGEDPEYRSFVKNTRFDYRQDLDAAMVSFAPKGRFLLARGRFDWRSLQSYARQQDGTCVDTFCRMDGSTPQRLISFLPVKTGLLALAVSPDNSAAETMLRPGEALSHEPPNAPVWVSIPHSILQTPESLPSGTRLFARGLEQAESVTISAALEGARMAARLEVHCANATDAAAIAAQLTHATELLRGMIEREHQKPNPADLSGVLASGAFRSDGVRVLGYWPIERAFLENVLGAQ